MNTGNTLVIDAFWVGNNHFPTIQNPNSNDGHVFYDCYEGNARHLGWMDLCALNSIIKKKHISHIILQNLDTLGKISHVIGEVKVCTSYRYNKFQIVSSVSKEKELIHCEPIYHSIVFGGWDIDENGEIPVRVQEYIRYLLSHTHVNSITYFTNKFKITASYDIKGEIEFYSEPNS